MILIDQAAEPRIPRAPLASCRRCGRHMTEALEFRQSPRAAGSQIRMRALRQAPRCPDEMRQACLALGHPGLVDPIAITDEEPGPIINQVSKGSFGALGVDHIEGDSLI